MSMQGELIPLEALSARQRERVRENLPLVQLAIDRMMVRARKHPPSRDRRDVFQEGALALMDAVRNHDPDRHGDFPPYAMARVHQAIGRYVREGTSLIRVPMIRQRRQAKGDEVERHRPAPLPRISTRGEIPIRRRREAAYADAHGMPGVTIGDAIRRRLERARRRATARLRGETAGGSVDRLLVGRCDAERWSIPDASLQKSVRSIAAELGCSAARVTRIERRFREAVATVLAGDRLFGLLVSLSRSRRFGSRHILEADDYRVLRRGRDSAAV